MSVTLQSLLELRALLDSVEPNCHEAPSRSFDDRSSAPEYAISSALMDHPSGVPVNHRIDISTDRLFKHIAR
jgi:hypothetical protein